MPWRKREERIIWEGHDLVQVPHPQSWPTKIMHDRIITSRIRRLRQSLTTRIHYCAMKSKPGAMPRRWFIIQRANSRPASAAAVRSVHGRPHSGRASSPIWAFVRYSSVTRCWVSDYGLQIIIYHLTPTQLRPQSQRHQLRVMKVTTANLVRGSNWFSFPSPPPPPQARSFFSPSRAALRKCNKGLWHQQIAS